MKRIIPVLLVFVLCLTCVVSPVSASSFDVPETYINILDYCNPMGFSSPSVSLPDSNGTITFDLPGPSIISDVDILFTSTVAVTSVKVGSTALTLSEVSSGVYRAYGDITYGFYDPIELSIVTSGSAKINFNYFRIYNGWLTDFGLKGSFDVYDGSTLLETKTQSSVSGTILYTFPNSSDTALDHFIIDLYCDDWEDYDYIAFRFRTQLNIKSVVGMSSSGISPLPVQISTHTDYNAINDSIYYYCIIDIRNLIRSNDYPIVQLRMNKRGNEQGQFHFFDCTGFVEVDAVEPEVFWLKKIFANFPDWFSDLKTGIVDKLDDLRDKIHSYMTSNHNSLMKQLQRMADSLNSLVSGFGFSDEADSFNESVSDQSQELEDMTNIMGSVEKPDINNIDFNPSTMVDTNTLVLATSGLSNVLGNQIIIRILLMALTFALVGFVLYGKK